MSTSPYANPPVNDYNATNWSGCRQRVVDFKTIHAYNPSFRQVPGFSAMNMFTQREVTDTTGQRLTGHSHIKLSHEFREYKPRAGHAPPNEDDDVRQLTFPLKSIWIESGLAPTDTNLLIGGEIDIEKLPHHIKKHIDATQRASGKSDQSDLPCTVCFIELTTESTATAPSMVDPTSPYGINQPNLQRMGEPMLTPISLRYFGTTPLLMHEPNPAPGQPTTRLHAWTEYQVTTRFNHHGHVLWQPGTVALLHHASEALNPTTALARDDGRINVVWPSTLHIASDANGNLSNATEMMCNTLYNCFPDALNMMVAYKRTDDGSHVKLPSPLFLSTSAINALIREVDSIDLSNPRASARVCGAMSKEEEEINGVSKNRTLQWLSLLKRISEENEAIANSVAHLQRHSDSQAFQAYMTGAMTQPSPYVGTSASDASVLHSVDCS